MRFILLTLFTLLLGGCDKYGAVEKLWPAELQADAKNRIEQLRKRDFAVLEPAFDESLKGRDLNRKTLALMADQFPPGTPSAIHLVRGQFHRDSDGTTYGAVYEYLFGAKSVVITITFQEIGGVRKIVGFYVTPQAVPLEEQNKFTFEGKGFSQYAVLAAAVAALVVSLFALVRCVRLKGLRRKWLWVLFILAGVGKIMVNWETGELEVMGFAFQLLSASFMAMVAEPTIIAFSIPVGALVFLSRYREGTAARRDIDAAARGGNPGTA